MTIEREVNCSRCVGCRPMEDDQKVLGADEFKIV